MTEFTSCLSSLVFGRTRAGPCFLFQESLRRLKGVLTDISIVKDLGSNVDCAIRCATHNNKAQL
jgi:hypothetical protein